MSIKKMQTVTWIVIIVSMLIGGLLGIYLIGTETGEYRYNVVFPIVIGTIGGFLIFLKISTINKKRNGNVPDFDERSLKLIRKYVINTFYLILFGSSIALIVVYVMGIQFIETKLLIIYLFAIYIILGFGTLITKKL